MGFSIPPTLLPPQIASFPKSEELLLRLGIIYREAKTTNSLIYSTPEPATSTGHPLSLVWQKSKTTYLSTFQKIRLSLQYAHRLPCPLIISNFLFMLKFCTLHAFCLCHATYFCKLPDSVILILNKPNKIYRAEGDKIPSYQQ